MPPVCRLTSGEPVSETNNAGANVIIPTGVRGSSPLAFRWYQNNNFVPSQTNMNLGFTPAQTGNAGSWYLVASNIAGAVTSAVINLVLYGPPTIVAQSPSNAAFRGQTRSSAWSPKARSR